MFVTRLIVCSWFACAAWATAQDEEPVQKPLPLEAQLFSERDPALFADLLKRAATQKLPKLTVVEARFLFHVDQRDDAAIARLTPELEALEKTFVPEQSQIFSQKEDFAAVVQYAKSLQALEANDTAAFKKHITEAFWLSPQQAAAFAPHIDALRLEQAMKTAKVDLTRPLRPLVGQEAVTPAQLLAMKQAPAIMFHFWSPWSREVELSMPDFVATSQALAKGNIPVVSVLISSDDDVLGDAREMKNQSASQASGAWVLDYEKQSFTSLFRIKELPTMVLVNPAGKVLFNGSPVDTRFWDELSLLAPAIERPDK